jgi:hypothetical protein
MPTTLKVFYSWQSDLPNNTNRGLIGKALDGAAEDVGSEVATEIIPVVDRDTSGVAGSPDIRQTIFSKIQSCDVFVADVSIIGNANGRFVCNPNVLVELGYALNALGENRVLLVHNDAFGRVEDLPFDLRGRRTVRYTARESDPTKSTERSRLIKTLGIALREIASERRKMVYCYLSAAIYSGTDTLMFHLFGTDQPVKEVTVALSDDGAVSRYIKTLQPGQSPTEQGIEAARQRVSIGPLLTLLPNTAMEVKAFRKNISGRVNCSFSANIQTDSHLFRERILIRRLPDGGALVSEILSVGGPTGEQIVWQHVDENFPKDFVVE